MIRAKWSSLAGTAFRSLVQRVSQRAAFRRHYRLRRLRRGHECFSPLTVAAEVLEMRALLTAPVAVADSYNVVHNHTLSGPNVLSNDQQNGPGTFVAVDVTSTSHGSLILNSSGTFTYVPTTGFVGSDSFTYQGLRGGTTYSNIVTDTITVTNSAPIANAQSYTIYKDSFDSAALSAHPVLYGDSDPDGDTLTASIYSGPSHGALTINSTTGAFVYTPTSGYFGADSWVAAVSDGFTSTNATISLTDTNPFSAQTNAPDTPVNDYSSYGPFSASQVTGGAQVNYDMTQGQSLLYSSLAADVKPIIAVEATYQGGVSGPNPLPAPDRMTVDLTYGGLSASTLYYSNSGLTVGVGTARFADQIDASSLATGHYQYSMTITSYYGSTTATRVYTGYQDIVNLQASEFGKGWTLAEKDGLAVQSGGVLWYSGTGATAWFASNGSGGYTSPAGPLNSSTLVLSGSVYTLTDKLGNAENFSSAGLLTSKVDVNGNTTSYAYSSGRLATITDTYGRTTTFSYASGLVSSITDIASQTTTLAHTSTNLTSITAPVPAGGVSAPVTSYAYTGNLLTTITDPDSNATGLTYSFGDRISQATFADTTTNTFSPAETAGLVNTSGGTGTSSSTPAAPYLPTHYAATYTDGLSNQSTTQFDVFGDMTSLTDALTYVTTAQFNSNGQLTQLTQPSPATGVAAPVTGETYDSAGNLTQTTFPDSSTESWTYGTSGGSLNRPLTHTDQRGKTTTFTYDSHGNVLTITDALSNVTTMTYNSNGTVATITAPNPSTGGASGGLVTSFTYDSDARVTRITNPDSTHKDFTYDTENHLLTSTDELGWRHYAALTYGDLSRLRWHQTRSPNPSTGSDRAAFGSRTYAYMTLPRT